MKKICHALFYDSNGSFFPPYLYSFVFLALIVVLIIVRLISPLGSANKVNISDTLILGMMVYVLGLIGVSTWGKGRNSNDKNNQ